MARDDQSSVIASSTRRNVAHLLATSAFTRGGSFLVNLAFRRILSPSAVGLWNLIDIAVTYLGTLTTGYSYTAERTIPMRRALNDQPSVRRLQAQLLLVNAIEAAVISVVVWSVLVLVGAAVKPDVRWAFLWLPLIFLGHKITAAFFLLMRSRREFREYSRSVAISAALDWTLLAWAWWGGLRGLIVGAAVTAVLKVIIFKIRVDRSNPLSLRSVAPLEPMGYGLRMAAWKATFTIGERFDAVVVVAVLGTAELAAYYLGFQLTRVAMELPLALFYVAAPMLLEKFAASPVEFRTMFSRYFRIAAFVFVPVAMVVGYYGSEWLILNFLPNYEGAVIPVKIIFLSLPALALRHYYYQLLTAHRRVGPLFVATLSSLPLFFLFYAGLPMLREDLVRFATASTATAFAHYGLLVVLTHHMLPAPAKVVKATRLRPMVYAVVAPAAIVVVDLLVRRQASGLLPTTAAAGLQAAMAAVALAGVAVFVLKDEDVVADIRAAFRRRPS